MWFWLIFFCKATNYLFLLCNCVTVIEKEWILICCMWFQPKFVGNIQSIDTSFLIFAITSIKPFFSSAEQQIDCQLSDCNGQESNVVYLNGECLPSKSSHYCCFLSVWEYVSQTPRLLWTLSLTTKWKTFNILLNICEAAALCIKKGFFSDWHTIRVIIRKERNNQKELFSPFSQHCISHNAVSHCSCATLLLAIKW